MMTAMMMTMTPRKMVWGLCRTLLTVTSGDVTTATHPGSRVRSLLVQAQENLVLISL